MLASAKIDLPIQNELGFSLPVDLDSEVAPKGRDWLSFLCTSIEDKNKIRSKSCPSPLSEGDLSGRHSTLVLYRAIAVVVTLIQ